MRKLFASLMFAILSLNSFLVLSGFCEQLWPNEPRAQAVRPLTMEQGGCAAAERSLRSHDYGQTDLHRAMPCCVKSDEPTPFFATIQTLDFSKLSLTLAYAVERYSFFATPLGRPLNQTLAPPVPPLLASAILRI